MDALIEDSQLRENPSITALLLMQEALNIAIDVENVMGKHPANVVIESSIKKSLGSIVTDPKARKQIEGLLESSQKVIPSIEEIIARLKELEEAANKRQCNNVLLCIMIVKRGMLKDVLKDHRLLQQIKLLIS